MAVETHSPPSSSGSSNLSSGVSPIVRIVALLASIGGILAAVFGPTLAAQFR